MAKRKRLEMLGPSGVPASDTKSMVPSRSRMPIAEIAGEVALRAALNEVAEAMTTAEREGRLVRRIPIAEIDRQTINRDRITMDEGELETLSVSIAERGQQMPIEVMRTGSRYALISGARRLAALDRLGRDEVMAFVREPESAVEAHVAMVEENEVRAPLSFYERANLVHITTVSGVFPDTRAALDTLFARAPAARRSKIARFLVLRQKLGAALRFPAAIPEKLGLRLATAIEADTLIARRISDALRKTPPTDAAAERLVLERALKGPIAAGSAKERIADGIEIEARAGRVVLSGAGVDAALAEAVRDWLVSHAKRKSASG